MAWRPLSPLPCAAHRSGPYGLDSLCNEWSTGRAESGERFDSVLSAISQREGIVALSAGRPVIDSSTLLHGGPRSPTREVARNGRCQVGRCALTLD